MRSKSGTIRSIASEHKFDNASEYAAVNFEPPAGRLPQRPGEDG